MHGSYHRREGHVKVLGAPRPPAPPRAPGAPGALERRSTDLVSSRSMPLAAGTLRIAVHGTTLSTVSQRPPVNVAPPGGRAQEATDREPPVQGSRRPRA
jgi:hypothetical protein